MKRKPILFEEYQQAMREYNDRGIRSFKRVLLHVAVFLGSGALWVVLYFTMQTPQVNSDGNPVESPAAWLVMPSLIALVAFYLVWLVIAIILSGRCPHCRKIFPRGKLELYDTIEGTATDIDGVTRTTYTSVFVTSCKYCDRTLWIVR